ncbi:beta clamp domain-containing protein [Blattabacterium cuenoti]|uniref:DNA polymerase III subunit beta n=1 Tax=Blattabacterium cuenoti TaxID=1653831 RepID=UPI00163BFF21|nr:DNA polymerase III subunit beta [Blattabacterium cuenoti]
MFITKLKTSIEQSSNKKISISITLIINFLQTFMNETLLLEIKKNILIILYKQDYYYIPIDNSNNTKNFTYPINWNKKPFLKKRTIIKIVFSYSTLLKILNYTLLFSEEQYFKNIINGVFFQLTPYVYNFILTDTYKLVQYTITHNNLKTNLPPIEFIMLNFSSLRRLHNILTQKLNIKKITMVIEKYNKKNIVQFQMNNNIFFCNYFNPTYIKFNSKFPKITDISCIINKNLFLNYIKRISFLSKKNPCIIRFIFNNQVKDTLKIDEEESINNNHNYYMIKCKFKLLNNNHNIIIMKFNTQFLIDILSSINESCINFELCCNKNIGLFKPFFKKKNKESIKILIMSII